MSSNSTIEWTESTWNPVTGCTKTSRGCENCYAERMARRLKAIGSLKYKNGFTVTIHPESLTIPIKWKKPRRIFVNSMSDLFHDCVPLSFIKNVFNVMNKCPQHEFQVLTKRAERLSELSSIFRWTQNIWAGVTIEHSDYLYRLNYLKNTDAKFKFISFEPLLSTIHDIDLQGIHWVIVGGESGPKARPIKKEWIINIKNQCAFYNVPFFFKQWGGFNKKKAGRLLDGEEWNEKPASEMTNKLQLLKSIY